MKFSIRNLCKYFRSFIDISNIFFQPIYCLGNGFTKFSNFIIGCDDKLNIKISCGELLCSLV